MFFLFVWFFNCAFETHRPQCPETLSPVRLTLYHTKPLTPEKERNEIQRSSRSLSASCELDFADFSDFHFRERESIICLNCRLNVKSGQYYNRLNTGQALNWLPLPPLPQCRRNEFHMGAPRTKCSQHCLAKPFTHTHAYTRAHAHTHTTHTHNFHTFADALLPLCLQKVASMMYHTL